MPDDDLDVSDKSASISLNGRLSRSKGDEKVAQTYCHFA